MGPTKRKRMGRICSEKVILHSRPQNASCRTEGGGAGGGLKFNFSLLLCRPGGGKNASCSNVREMGPRID